MAQRGTPARWRIAVALATVYLAWGATYPAIAVLVRTVPPFLGMGARFLLGGVILALGLRVLGGRARGSPPARRSARRSWDPGSSAPSGSSRWPRSTSSRASLPSSSARFRYEASGEVAGSHVPQAPDALRATIWQLGGAGLALCAVGLVLGEAGDVRWHAMDTDTLLAFAFLVIVGSAAAYPALVWLLAETPTSTAATYAYVNPVVALALAAVLLDERFSAQALVGAAIILASVVVVVRSDAVQAAAASGKLRRSS